MFDIVSEPRPTARVIPMPITPLSAPPPGAPLGLTRSADDLTGYAIHSAEMRGLDWWTLHADQQEEIRQACLVGLWLADPASRRICARHIAAEVADDFPLLPRLVRDTVLRKVRLGLNALMRAVAGHQAAYHRAVVGLAEQDEREERELASAMLAQGRH